MEYANSGSLRNYLKENFNNLTWEDKYKLTYQLASAVACLHDEGIVHCDLVSYYTYLLNIENKFNNIFAYILLFIIAFR
jgi:serine/threonine protein kinase